MVQEAIENGQIDHNIFPQKQVNGRTIFEVLKKRNTELQKIVDEWLHHVADGLVSLTHIFNTCLILIGGGVSAQDELFIQPLREIVLKKAMPIFGVTLDVKAAELYKKCLCPIVRFSVFLAFLILFCQ
jgi:glucokinase